MEVPLTGDSAESLRALLPLLEQKTDTSWRERIAKGNDEWRELIEQRARTSAEPVNPQLPFQELSPRLPDRAILTCDSGSCVNWFARNLQMREGMMASLSGSLASMGAAVPYAIAAKMAHPDRPVIAMVGDGAMQMNNMAEMITVGKYWKRWRDPRLVVCVFNNEDLNEVTWEQRVMDGNPRFDASQDIPNVPYARFAELIGLRGVYVDDPEKLGEAWDQALSADRPVVLEVKSDPEVAPLPPHVTLKQAKAFFTAMSKDSRAGHVIGETARQLINEMLPGKRD